jgi:hypothetical protein
MLMRVSIRLQIRIEVRGQERKVSEVSYAAMRTCHASDCVCVCVCLSVCVCLHTNMYTYVCMYIYVCIHIHTYIYISAIAPCRVLSSTCHMTNKTYNKLMPDDLKQNLSS